MRFTVLARAQATALGAGGLVQGGCRGDCTIAAQTISVSRVSMRKCIDLMIRYALLLADLIGIFGPLVPGLRAPRPLASVTSVFSHGVISASWNVGRLWCVAAVVGAAVVS